MGDATCIQWLALRGDGSARARGLKRPDDILPRCAILAKRGKWRLFLGASSGKTDAEGNESDAPAGTPRISEHTARQSPYAAGPAPPVHRPRARASARRCMIGATPLRPRGSLAAGLFRPELPFKPPPAGSQGGTGNPGSPSRHRKTGSGGRRRTRKGRGRFYLCPCTI